MCACESCACLNVRTCVKSVNARLYLLINSSYLQLPKYDNERVTLMWKSVKLSLNPLVLKGFAKKCFALFSPLCYVFAFWEKMVLIYDPVNVEPNVLMNLACNVGILKNFHFSSSSFFLSSTGWSPFSLIQVKKVSAVNVLPFSSFPAEIIYFQH